MPASANGTLSFWDKVKNFGSTIWNGLSSAGNWVSGLFNAGASIYDTYTNKKIAEQNLSAQKEENEYQHNLQQQIFEREDNATQRKVEDLEKAGLNPVLAAGQSANAGQVVSTQAPQNHYQSNFANVSSSALNMVNALTQVQYANQQISQSKAQQLYYEALAKNVDAETMFLLGPKTDNTKADTTNKQDTHKGYSFDYDYYTSKGFSTRGPESSIGKEASDLGVDPVVNAVNKQVGNMIFAGLDVFGKLVGLKSSKNYLKAFK